jgi:transcriptional regulator with XRE-family HTH domain
MLAPVDLHPDDMAVRDRLAAQLRALRTGAGISQRDAAARLGICQSRLFYIEQRRAWQVRLVQRWARIYDHRLALSVSDLTVPDDGDELAAVYAAQRPATLDTVDRLHLRQVVNDLARIRRQRMSAETMGRLLGRSDSAVQWREDNPDGALLASVQQYARALGGHLDVDLAPIATTGAGAS